ncbi:hypothetical protein BGZ88_003301 [Linnemannia elongata]|nr:hypothetical protein BGZ88_003301 [Linnemannia elongata]
MGGIQYVPYVLLDDIQDYFQDTIKFIILPKRFAYRPGQIVEVVTTGSTTTSPRQLTRQNTTALQSTSASPADKDKFRQSSALFEDYVKATENGQKEQAALIQGDFRQGFSELNAALDRNHDLQQQLDDMQQLMLQMQRQALDRLADLQGRVKALLTATYELHEYSIPRLFIILPRDSSAWDPVSILNNQVRLYFLCECGEHTKALSGDNTNIPHHIHLAKHEGYDLQRPKEFFRKYGRYMLTLLEMIKYGVTIAGYAVPALAAVSAPGGIDTLKNSLDTVSESAVNQSIEFLRALSREDLEGQDPAKDIQTDSLTGQEGVEGADLRHLEAFIKSKDEHRALGNLYRIITQDGHVKWICIGHYRSAYKEQDQKAFITAVELNGGCYDPHLGKATVKVWSKILAAGFFDALAKARRVDELDITLDWECTTSDLEALGDTLKIAAVSILRLDLRRFRTSFATKLLPTSTRYEVFSRILGLPSMKTIHVVVPMDLVTFCSLQTKRHSQLPKLSYEVVGGYLGEKGLGALVETLETNSNLTNLNLEKSSNWVDGAVALSEALKTNTTLAILSLENNSIGDNGAVALSEALKTNTTLATLNLRFNSIGKNGAVVLSEALKTNTTLSTLYLAYNSIGDNGAVALSEALKTNTALATLYLAFNSIEENGALALAEVSKTGRSIL